MSDRLQELLRQRALLQEHAVWLDREIEAESGQHGTRLRREEHPLPRPAPPPPPPAAGGDYLASQAAAILHRSPAVPTPASPPAMDMESPVVAAAADAIMSEYQVKPDTLKSDLRRGCFLYFFIALAVFAAAVAILYIVIPSSPPAQ